MLAPNQLTRRRFLRDAAVGLGVLSCNAALGQPFEKAAYLGVETSATTNLSRVFAVSSEGEIVSRLPVGFRAHGLAEANNLIAVFPRRPGNAFALIDQSTFEIRGTHVAPTNRHFFGHGAFSRDGAYLLTTENDLDSLQGVIGIYDVASGKRIDEIRMPVAGPHEITRHPTENKFFIALGGLETHPDYGRTPFNLGDFRSQIVKLDLDTGHVEQMGYWAGSEGISLRHLAIDRKGRLYIGGQVYDQRRAKGTNLAWVVEEENVSALPLGEEMQGYISSVAAGEAQAMMSSKESGRVLWLEGVNTIKASQNEGASAVAIGDKDEFIAGAKVLRIGAQDVSAWEGWEFDNHGLAIKGLMNAF